MATYDVTVKRTTREYATFRVTVGDIGTGQADIEAAGVRAAEADWAAGKLRAREGDLYVYGYLRVKEATDDPA